MSEKSQSRAVLLALGAVLLWSTVATAFKLSLQHMSPLQLLGWAGVFSTLVLAVGVSWQQGWGELKRQWCQRPLYYLALGVLNPAFYYLVLFRAYDLLPAQQAQALNYTWALTLALLAVPLLKQSLQRVDLLAMLLGYSGALVIATRGDLLALEFDSLPGVGLALFSTLIWALYWILNTRAEGSPAVTLLLCFLCGTPLVWGLMIWQGEWMLPPWQGLLGAAYVGVFEMGLTFMLWLGAMRAATHVSRIANLIFLSPFLSLVFIYLFLHEPIAPATFVGLALIVAAVVIQQRGRRSEPAPAAEQP
ncbi:MAG: DMT family transporter [Oceanospirillales bacterium]|uniref:EamA domain-containing membrane protein RarD n=1 Tax=Marinobacterium halophilum TaxID=267374 RepID=A0A2P8ESS4_9GAMM|nr:DMT family transporter [Marinobacterium halophilum]MBR9828279.1 DMT family transporter [Oceanospirillales bacterium]PSL12485.1 EamA domain-containing membrane protein RarD [Marinobacterium halophilum]